MKKKYLLYSLLTMLSFSPLTTLAADTHYTNDSSHFEYFASSDNYVYETTRDSTDELSSLVVYKLVTEDNTDDVYRVVFEKGSLSSLMALLHSEKFKDNSLDLVILPSVTYDTLDVNQYAYPFPIIPTLYIDSLTLDSLDDVSIMIREFKTTNVFINSIPDIERIDAEGGSELNQYLSFFEQNAGTPFTFSGVPDSFLDKLSEYNLNISSEALRDKEDDPNEEAVADLFNIVSESNNFADFVGILAGRVLVDPDDAEVMLPDDRNVTVDVKNSPFGVSGSGYSNFFINWVPNFSLKSVSEHSPDFYKVLPISFEGSSEKYAPFIQVVDYQPFNSIWNLSLKATPFTSDRSLDELKGSIISLNQYKVIASTNNGDFVSGDKPLDPINLNNDMYTLMTKEDALDKGVWTFSFSNSPVAHYEENSVIFAINKDHMNKKETYVSDFTWIYYNTPV